MSALKEVFERHKIELQPGTAPELPRNTAQCAQLRNQVKEVLIEMNNAAIKAGRDLNDEETKAYKAGEAVMAACSARLGNSYGELKPVNPFGVPGNGAENTHGAKLAFPELAEFIKNPDTGIRASLSDGGDLQHVLPGRIVYSFLAAYPNTDPFGLAGANITTLDAGWIDGAVPIVAAGTDPSVYAEGSGPTADESAKVYALELKTPQKIAFLSLPTEEVIADVEVLASVLGAEGVRRLLNGLSRRVTSDLVSQLTSAGATVSGYTDNYEAVLDLINAIPPAFSSSRLCFMGNRHTRARLYNTRASGTGAPLFTPDLSQLLGYEYVVNDFLPNQKLLFGSFSDGVFIRKSAMFAQRLIEAYREQGKIGFRFYQRSDWGFFSEAATNSQVEQPIYCLTPGVNFGS